jgi:hypothetical protein
MSLIAKENQRPKRDPIPAGTHHAICYGVVDIGTQREVWDGNEKLKRKVNFLFEIPSERIQIEKDGKRIDLPRGTHKKFTNTLSDKSDLYKNLVSWRGAQFTPEQLKGFDLFTVIGANCLLQMVAGTAKDGSAITYVNGIMGLPKGMPKLKSENKHVMYSIDENGLNIPDGVPDWMKKIIMESPEIMAINKAANNQELNKAQSQYMENTNAPEAEYVDPDLQDQPNDDIPF